MFLGLAALLLFLSPPAASGAIAVPIKLFVPIPSKVTFFSEAGLWGDSLMIEAPVDSDPGETVRLVTNTQIKNANLLKRISSVRLQCGSRSSQVTLFTAYNMWSEFATYARPFYCHPGETVDVNLHTQAPQLADKVGSVYFVAHALDSIGIPLSFLVTDGWTEQLDNSLPSEAKADGGPRLRLISLFSFTLRQDLVLDHSLCWERNAHFELFASLKQDGYFSVSVYKTYVDSNDWDTCQGFMEDDLKNGALDAARGLEDGLNNRILLSLKEALDFLPLVRYYLVPTNSIREFDLYGGQG